MLNTIGIVGNDPDLTLSDLFDKARETNELLGANY
jgi:hypothetical protein